MQAQYNRNRSTVRARELDLNRIPYVEKQGWGFGQRCDSLMMEFQYRVHEEQH